MQGLEARFKIRGLIPTLRKPQSTTSQYHLTKYFKNETTDRRRHQLKQLNSVRTPPAALTLITLNRPESLTYRRIVQRETFLRVQLRK